MTHIQGDKRARTRATLIEAAAQLIGEQGYERTSLEAVAARAGMTRGAIYGNFKNKEELFLAVAGARWEPIVPRFEPGASFRAQMRILAEAVVAAIPARRPSAVGAASFQVYALTHQAMRSRVLATNAEIYQRFANGIRALVPEQELPMPADTFVRVLHAMIDGILMLEFLTPELIGEETIFAAFDALAGARTTPSPQRRSPTTSPTARKRDPRRPRD
jgi:AcrR family transcriptional regulator